MSITWVAEVPDMKAGSGLNIRMAKDSERKVHLAYIVNNQLTYKIGTPGPISVVFRGSSIAAVQAYQWTSHDDVLPSSVWSLPSTPFDLAVDSRNRAHLCFPGIEMQDQMTLGDVQHAIWDGSTFVSADVLSPVAASTFPSGLAMTIANDDSVHIAFSDNQLGLRYATRAHDSDPFQLENVDTRAGTFSNLSIAVGSGGNTGVSYILKLTGAGNDAVLMYAEKMSSTWLLDTACPGPITFGPGAWAAGLGLANVGTNSLVIDPNGVPHIAFFNAASGSPGIRHGTWTIAGRGFWAFGGYGELVDQTGLPATAKMLLDKNNVLHVAYQASPNAGDTSELRFATRTLSGWAAVTVDPSVDSGWSIAAAVDPTTGEPHIASGFEASGVGSAFALKHSWAVDLIRIPFPPTHKTRPILRRPG
jgi:hypothetical protein